VGRVGNRYVCQGGQTEKILGANQTNVCPPWPETLPAALRDANGIVSENILNNSFNLINSIN